MTKDQFILRLAERIYNRVEAGSGVSFAAYSKKGRFIAAATEAYEMVEAQIDLYGPFL